MNPVDSPTKWVNDHIRSYVDSGGTKGHHWNGLTTLLLTTTGRSSGVARRTALIYGQHGGDYVIVGSWGGNDKHPSWYLNLLANPEVTLQVGPEVFQAIARTASPQEKPELWKMMAKAFPQYDTYQRKTAREIPVVLLSPVRA
jgi:deazaflavin-dependent oxidoreductase (nitroreductase family)